ncbi:TolC family protein [Spirochaeta isovalerica]|uniref:Outer membrane protein TolC n=1 Tax=Spirochaeta isovalerica TaxID=150 RepID=A0A841RDS1_9SPIO|nr:TolC family protein [Spirochaeta isovalerica]MBB6480999.1 outer membrane protein TolC [Spirochaeta isovalerica]
MKTTNRKLLLLTLIFSMASFLPADPLILSLEEAWNIMEINNSDLNKLYLQWGAALRKSGSREYLRPSISAEAGISRSSGLISLLTNEDTVTNFDEKKNWTVSGALKLSWSLAPGVSLEAKSRAIDEELLRLQIEEKTRSLKYSLTVLYYQILAGEEQIALQEENLRLTTSRVEQAEEKYNQGLLSELDLLSARLSAARDVPKLQKAKADQEKRYLTFKSYLEMDRSTEVALTGRTIDSIELPDLETALMDVRSHIDLKLLVLQIEKAKISLEKSGKTSFVPTLTPSLNWNNNISTDFYDAGEFEPDLFKDTISLGLTLKIPLDSYLPGSSERLAMQSLEEAIEIAEINREKSARSLEDKVRTLYLDMELSRSNVELQKLSISLLEQTVAKNEQLYENGRLSLADLEDSRMDLKAAVLTLEDEKRNLTNLTIEAAYLLNLN